ncbi:MAG: hypothetical protein WD965_02460 [Actinomycetota bacterium]
MVTPPTPDELWELTGGWREGPFIVGVPVAELVFWRFVRNDPPLTDDFAAEFELRDRFPREDHFTYRGFSAWTGERIARDTARDVLNPILEKKGEITPFSHIARFRVSPDDGHACGWIGPEREHWGIWGPAQDLADPSRVEDVFSILERREYDD